MKVVYALQVLGGLVYFFFVTGFAMFLEPTVNPSWIKGLTVTLYFLVSGLVAVFFILVRYVPIVTSA